MMENYQLRKAAGAYWLLDMSQSGKENVLPVSLNEAGAKIWSRLCEGARMEEIAKDFAGQYQIAESEALEDVKQFVSQLQKQGIVTELSETK